MTIAQRKAIQWFKENDITAKDSNSGESTLEVFLNDNEGELFSVEITEDEVNYRAQMLDDNYEWLGAK